ncbi:TolC family outer membrane protein [Ferrimonas marina]|nr:TolC family outer membrane protein [Ferrimonas marina]
MKTQISAALLAASLCAPLYAKSLEQTVAYTLDTHPQVRQQFNRFKATEEQVNQVRGGYFPQVDLFGRYGYQQSDTPVGRTRSGDHDLETTPQQAGVSLSQLLFDGFRTPGEVERLGKEAAADQWALFAQAEDTALDVAQVYTGVLKARHQLELAEHNLDNHRTIHDKIVERSQSGLGDSADLAQSTGRLARAHANRVAAVNNLLDAEAQFRQVTNDEPVDLVSPMPDHDRLPSDLAAALLATDNHPVLRSAQLDIAAAQAERTVARANYYPELNLKLEGSWGQDLDNYEGHNNDLSAMLEFKYNLFAGGSTKARSREAAYKLGSAKSVREQAQRSVFEGMRLAWNAYEQLALQREFIRQHVEAAKEAQLAYSEQFRLGQRTLLDLLDTENELFLARQDYIDAEMDELMAKYRVLNASGQLLDSLRITRPSQWNAERDYE